MDVVWQYFIWCILMLILTLIAMFFSSFEVSITSISTSRLKKLVDEGNEKAKSLLKLKNRQSDFIAHISMSAIFCICLTSIIATSTFGEAVTNGFWKLMNILFGVDPHVYHDYMPLAVIITFVVAFLIASLFGSVLPKKLVLDDREKFAITMIGFLPFLSALFRPFTYLPIKAANGIARLFLVDPHLDVTVITEDEIRMLVDVGNESGSIEHSEYEMINNIFDFDDLTAGEVMTHRTEICAVNIKQPLNDIITLAIDEGFSRILVYENAIDNIVGTIYVKDLLVFTSGDRDINQGCIADYMRNVLYAPESVKCRMLFKEFKEKKIHIAVIVDEYGGTAGIVTMEDLLESIVGNIQDEYDQEEPMIEPLGTDCYMLDGGISVEDLCKLFDIEIEAEQHAETLAGLITNALGFIPEESQHSVVVIGNVEFCVIKVEDRRITRVKATKINSEILGGVNSQGE